MFSLRPKSTRTYHIRFENLLVLLVCLHSVLDIHALVIYRYLGLFDLDQIVQRLVDQLLWLELDLLLIHFVAKIFRSCLVSWDQIDCQLSTMLVFAYNRESSWVVEHVGKGFGG